MQDSVYAPFGVIVTGSPERPERVRVPPRMLDLTAVLKKFRWDAGQFEVAQKFQFPSSHKTSGALGAPIRLRWQEDELDAWAQRLQNEIAMLKLR
jgi:hypothetical protein